MPHSLAPIPDGVAIVDQGSAITIFFRQRWQQLIDSFQISPDVGTLEKTNQGAALVTTTIFTTRSAGVYRISYYVRKTAIDGVNSSLTVTLGWSDGLAQTEAGAALAVDAVTAQQSGSKVVYADALVDLSIAVAYVSNTLGNMKYALRAVVEQLA